MSDITNEIAVLQTTFLNLLNEQVLKGSLSTAGNTIQSDTIIALEASYFYQIRVADKTSTKAYFISTATPTYINQLNAFFEKYNSLMYIEKFISLNLIFGITNCISFFFQSLLQDPSFDITNSQIRLKIDFIVTTFQID